MAMTAEIFESKILCCPKCLSDSNKAVRFSDIQDLNIHLKMKHETSWKISFAGKLKGSASPVPRSKRQ